MREANHRRQCAVWMSGFAGIRRILLVGLAGITLASGCARPFERPDQATAALNPDGDAVLALALTAHGGDSPNRLKDISVGLSGDWKWLIKRIQPLVTDFSYRVDSEERLIVDQGIYAASYRGPNGTKKVVRTPTSIRVFYNGKETFDPDVLQSSAMTADGFFHFLLGPFAFMQPGNQFTRLADERERGRNYFRIHAQRQPGFGTAASDEVILWVDANSHLLYRMEITLEGYRTTQGAHVDVTFLEYDDTTGYLLPVEFHERVRAPIAIDAHSWRLTGLDVNRGLSLESVDGPAWQGVAVKAAKAR